jgi:hypothetical protein
MNRRVSVAASEPCSSTATRCRSAFGRWSQEKAWRGGFGKTTLAGVDRLDQLFARSLREIQAHAGEPAQTETGGFLINEAAQLLAALRLSPYPLGSRRPGRQVAHRDRLRDHRPIAPPGPTRRTCRVDPRALAD